MLKQRISNDLSRVNLLVIAAAYFKKKSELVSTLSERLRRRLILLAKTFPADLERLAKAAKERRERISERRALVRTLRFAIRDAQMGLIRHARRHEEAPEGLATYLIPEQREQISLKSNEWFELARDLIGHNERFKDSQKLTNPSIEELKQRLHEAECSSWKADAAVEAYKEARQQVAWSRTQAQAVIGQLNAELNYQLREQGRASHIETMQRFGFRWYEPACHCGK